MNHVRTRLDVTSVNQDFSVLNACFNINVKNSQWEKLSDINDVQMKEWYQMNDLLLREKLKMMMNDLNVIKEALTVKILW